MKLDRTAVARVNLYDSSVMRDNVGSISRDGCDAEASPGGVPGGELTGMYVREGGAEWGVQGGGAPRLRPAQRKFFRI